MYQLEHSCTNKNKQNGDDSR